MATRKAAAKKSIQMPEPMPGPERVLYRAGCSSCHHVPIGVNTMLTVLITVIFMLSFMLMASAITVETQEFQLKVFNDSSGTTINTVASR